MQSLKTLADCRFFHDCRPHCLDPQLSLPLADPTTASSMSAFNSLDYRRFDHLGSDSDEEESLDEHMQQELMKFMQNRQADPTPSVPSPASQRTEYTAGPIKIHPQDTSVPRWVYSDPETWEAAVCECELEPKRNTAQALCGQKFAYLVLRCRQWQEAQLGCLPSK